MAKIGPQKVQTSPVKKEMQNDKSADSKVEFAGSEADGSENIGQIRSILFGSQMRDYENRFDRIEERMTREVEVLRDEMHNRLDTLEIYFKKEVGLLNSHLRSGKEESDESLSKLSLLLEQQDKGLGQQLDQFKQKTRAQSQELQEQILSQAKKLSEEIRKKHAALSDALDQHSKELRKDKVGRGDLAELLMELSLRLNGDMASQLGIAAKSGEKR